MECLIFKENLRLVVRLEINEHVNVIPPIFFLSIKTKDDGSEVYKARSVIAEKLLGKH